MSLSNLVKPVPSKPILSETEHSADFNKRVEEAKANGSTDPNFDAVFGNYLGRENMESAFVVPGAFSHKFKTISEKDIFGTTGITKALLSQKDMIKLPLEAERPVTKEWRSKFYSLLSAMDRADAHESLEWLLRTFDDLTDPATILDLRNKVAEWAHLGEQYIGAVAVGYLLLGSLRRELDKFDSITQENAAQNIFETLSKAKVQEVDEKGKIKEKAPTASSMSLSERNQRLARVRLRCDALFELEEQIDYVERMTLAIEKTYDLMQKVSFQNQGLSGMGYRQGA